MGGRLAGGGRTLLRCARGAARAGSSRGRAARAAAPRSRELGAGDVRGSVLPPAVAPARALPAGCALLVGRLRDELGGKRQGVPRDAFQAPLRPIGRRGCGRRDRGGVRSLEQDREIERAAPVSHGSCLLGTRLSARRIGLAPWFELG